MYASNNECESKKGGGCRHNLLVLFLTSHPAMLISFLRPNEMQWAIENFARWGSTKNRFEGGDVKIWLLKTLHTCVHSNSTRMSDQKRGRKKKKPQRKNNLTYSKSFPSLALKLFLFLSTRYWKVGLWLLSISSSLSFSNSCLKCHSAPINR